MSLIATMFALATTTTPTTPSADDFLTRLETMPVVLEDVSAAVDLNNGVDLEVNFNLSNVVSVTIAAQEDDDGSGHGLVLVGAAVVAEFDLAATRSFGRQSTSLASAPSKWKRSRRASCRSGARMRSRKRSPPRPPSRPKTGASSAPPPRGSPAPRRAS